MFKLKSIVTGMLIGASLTAHAADSYKMAYLTSWGLSNPEVLEQSKINTYMLSFGQWDAQGVISTSDGIASVPEYNAYFMSPAYITWTNLKFNNPQRKMIISFGGQAYESIWSYISTPEQRQAVAKNLAALLTQNFPVYSKNLSPSQQVGDCLSMNWDGSCNFATYQSAGTVQLDGIDFDFEKAARLTDEEGANLLDLATRVKALIPSNKLMSLTTYHVGADPVNCADNTVTENCSFVESSRSAHNGEVIKLLEDSKNVFNFFNAMTYDAGNAFKYQVAMQNYAQHVGSKAKVLVGTSNNQQWASTGPCTETQANNVQRAKWASENGYGGFFIWALGANSNQMSMADQVSTTNAMIDAMSASQADGGTNSVPPSNNDPVTPSNNGQTTPSNTDSVTPPATRQDVIYLRSNATLRAIDATELFKTYKKVSASTQDGTAWTDTVKLPQTGIPEGSVFEFQRTALWPTNIVTAEFGTDTPLAGEIRTYSYLNGKWTTDAITINNQAQLNLIDNKADGLSAYTNNLTTTTVRVADQSWVANIYLPVTAKEGATVKLVRDSLWATNLFVKGSPISIPRNSSISFQYIAGNWKANIVSMTYPNVINALNTSAQTFKNDLMNAQKTNAIIQITP